MLLHLLLFVALPTVLLLLHAIGTRFEPVRTVVPLTPQGTLPPCNGALFSALLSPLKRLPLPLVGMGAADATTPLPPLSVEVKGLRTDPQLLVQLTRVVDIPDAAADAEAPKAPQPPSDAQEQAQSGTAGATASTAGIKRLSSAGMGPASGPAASVAAATAMSARRARVLGRTLPLLYFDAATFRLVIMLAAHGRMPWSLLGSVKLRTVVRQLRAVDTEEVVDVAVTLGDRRAHRRGTQVDFVTRVVSHGSQGSSGGATGGEGVAAARPELVWESTTTLLFFHRGNKNAPPLKRMPAHQDQPVAVTHSMKLPGDLGRRYAAVCRDYNPIHLFAWSAALFGFKRTMVHGMCLADICVPRLRRATDAALMRDASQGRGNARNVDLATKQVELDVAFLRPVFIPATVHLDIREVPPATDDSATGAQPALYAHTLAFGMRGSGDTSNRGSDGTSASDASSGPSYQQLGVMRSSWRVRPTPAQS